jgi:hypothetical protein
VAGGPPAHEQDLAPPRGRPRARPLAVQR